MDKFGIFKLINSLYGALNSKTPDKTDNGIFDSLLAPKEKKSETPSVPPLQNTMVSAMKSHDKFVERVLKNNPKK